MDNFPRADKASITYPDGTSEIIEAGETSKALNYEVEDMNNCISSKVEDTTLSLSIDVMGLMDDIRKKWHSYEL